MTPIRQADIGGGAAGFFGAIAAASPQTEVTIFEAGRQVLSKVRISGGGRCNVTHACFDPAQLVSHYPRGNKALRGPFSQFQPRDTVAWFQKRGVDLKTESDGRMFPVTDDSGTIVNCLKRAAEHARVTVKTGTPAVQVEHSKTAPQFGLQLKTGQRWECDRILLASGSSPQGYRIAKNLGHRIRPPVPSLFTFAIRDDRLEGLAGISVPAATLKLQTADGAKLHQTGPLLVTHWGLSGPAVLKLSAWGARSLHDGRYRASLTVNWLAEIHQQEVRQALMDLKSTAAKRTIASYPVFQLPKRLWQSLVFAAEIQPGVRWADLSKQGLNRLVVELTQGRYEVQGKGQFKEEFVTCGGGGVKAGEF